MKQKAINGIAHFLLMVMVMFMPTIGKRLMYMTSLNFYLAREGVFKQTTLQEFSARSKLNLPIESFRLPKMAVSLIWDRVGLMKLVGSLHEYTEYSCPMYSSAKRMAEEIVDHTPRQMHYPRKKMVLDTMRLFYAASTNPRLEPNVV